MIPNAIRAGADFGSSQKPIHEAHTIMMHGKYVSAKW
jgi:hypothetical protein